MKGRRLQTSDYAIVVTHIGKVSITLSLSDISFPLSHIHTHLVLLRQEATEQLLADFFSLFGEVAEVTNFPSSLLLFPAHFTWRLRLALDAKGHRCC